MNDLAAQSLDLVNRELTNTLDAARRELESYVDGHSDQKALDQAAELLHLASGALKIVDIQGAALLAEEMEHVCRKLRDAREQQDVDQGLEALTRAMVQLPAYVERLLSGGHDVALVLLPLLNDLRRVRGKPLLSEGTLLLLHSGTMRARASTASVPPAAADGGTTAEGREFQRLATRLRPAFQAALLGWLRGDRPARQLGELVRIAGSLEAAATRDPVRQLWDVLGGVLIALQQDALEATVTVKQLIGQADRQLKRLIDAGESMFANAPPVDLVNNLLYYVARAGSRDEKLEAIRKAYGLGDVIPDTEQLDEAREVLAGPSVRLMRTVAQAIKEDLASVKDVLDIFVRTGMEDAEQLKPQLDMLKKIGDTLGVLGLEQPREQIQREAGALGRMLAEERAPDQNALEQVAATLLDVEDALDRELIRAVMPVDDDAPAGESDAKAQYRHVTQAVMGECIVNLAKVKEAVIHLVDNPGNVRALDQVSPQLRGITAGLLMLNKTKAVRVVERIGAVITSRLSPGEEPMKPELLERLADAIVSVEYYMETVSAGRNDPWYMLDNAERCLALLERAPLTGRAAAADAPPPAASKPAPLRPEPAVMEVEPDRSDPELLELFIEEVKEEIKNIEQHLPNWLQEQDDTEALISVRRSFHTLKGSGRVVGAQLIGEYAWSIESLLNRIINQTLAPTPPMLEFIESSADALPELVEQLEAGITPKLDIRVLMKQAEAFAAGDATAATLTGEALQLPEAADAEGPEPEPAATASMDPVLAEIFVKEMHSHLASIRQYLADTANRPAPYAVEEPLYRACHTLLGSANMAGFRPMIALATPLAEHLRRHYEAGSGLDAAGLRALTSAAAEIEKMADALSSEADYEHDVHAVIEALEALRPPARDRQPVQPTDTQTLQPEPEQETAGFDPEIAGIFAEEASELLETAETALQVYRERPDQPESLTPLQRLLHTLKGGARMAGVTAMGDLSHSLESLLSTLAGGAESPEDAVGLIQQSLDMLHHMRDAIDSGRPVPAQSAEPLIARLETAHRTASTTNAAPDGAGPAPTPETPEPPDHGGTTVLPRFDLPAYEATPAEDPDARAEATGVLRLSEEDIVKLEVADEDRARPASSAVPGLPVEDVPAEEEGPSVEGPPVEGAPVEAPPVEEAPVEEAPRPAPVAGERADVARVSALLLDSLLNNAGEISIFQSRLNQQIHSIEFNLGELGQTVTRLREQLRKLEAETETQILHRHQGDPAVDEAFDPLELDRYSTIQQLSRALAESASDVASINDLLRGLTNEADTLLIQQARVTTELQDGLMQTRMVPFERHASRLARIVRQASADTGKRAELIVEGAGSELDRQVLDAMLPAFEHLLRNAVVHGIEPAEARRQAGKPPAGRVGLKLRREGSEVLMEVADDGAGLNLEAIRRKAQEQRLLAGGQQISDEQAVELILKPGFSTANELTQAAGRGVGMDVVDNEIKKLGGSMRIETTPGQGTRFFIRLPYTLAITQALIVNVGDETFALPLPTVEGITRVPKEQLLRLLTEDDPRLEYGGVNYRVQHLGGFVGAAPSALPDDDSAVALVLVRAGESSTALLTDSLEGSREIVVKTLGPHLTSVPGVSGATILGDGRVIVILDAPTLVRAQKGELAVPAAEQLQARTQVTALVVDDSITMRRVTERLLERRGVRVLTARDGLDALTVLQEHTPDIILLDIEMPRMDGYQFATHVRNDPKLSDVPIIMITSRSGEKHRAKAIEIGVNDYLSKPYQESQLIASIEGLLGEKL